MREGYTIQLIRCLRELQRGGEPLMCVCVCVCAAAVASALMQPRTSQPPVILLQPVCSAPATLHFKIKAQLEANRV